MAPKRAPAYHRLDSDDRRGRLLDLGRELFTTRSYDDLSMSAIAREAGISKALLYHYFPSKQAYFVATLHDAAAELAERVNPDEDLPPAEQLDAALSAWLEWVDANSSAYGGLLRGTLTAPAVREMVDRVRHETARLIHDRLWDEPGQAPPRLRAAICGWLWLVDGTCLDWVEHDDFTRDELHELLAGALRGAIVAAGCPGVAARLAA